MSEGTVTSRRDLHDLLSILRLRPDTPRRFTPGQHVELGFHRGDEVVRRYYSLASPPQDQELEIVATITREDRASFWPAVGARVAIGEPGGGNLTLAGIEADALVVFLATGTGVAPFMSMLRAGAAFRKLVLLHAVRHEQDLAYRDELAARRSERFVYEPIVSRDPAWPGRKGRIQDALAVFDSIAGEPLHTDAAILACGNPAMIDSVRAMRPGLRAEQY